MPSLRKNLKHLLGHTVMIRTVTMTDVGVLVDINKACATLRRASWIGNTGCWTNFCHLGTTDDTQNFHPNQTVYVATAGVIDVTEMPPEWWNTYQHHAGVRLLNVKPLAERMLAATQQLYEAREKAETDPAYVGAYKALQAQMVAEANLRLKLDPAPAPPQ